MGKNGGNPYAELSRESLAMYGQYVHQLKAEPHHMIWVPVLEDESKSHYVVVAPPASAKTTWAGIIFPGWEIGRQRALGRDLHVGYITNSDDMSVKRSMAVRDTVAQNARYQATFPEVKPDPEKGWGQQNWYIYRERRDDKDPTFHAAGLFGQVLGDRYDLLVVDDICTQDNMATKRSRDKVWDFFNETLRTRVTKNGRIIVIMTRWHHDDLAGRLIKQGWPTCHIPALNEQDESYWPGEWPVERLLDERDGERDEHGKRMGGIGTRAFEGQFQGRPTAEEGNILKWFPEYGRVPVLRYKIHRWDTAFSKEKTSDYSAMVSLGLGDDNHIYVLGAWQDRLETPELAEAIRALAQRDHPRLVILELAAKAKEAVEAVKKASMINITTEPVPHNMDKTARVNAVAPTFEAHRVLFPASYHPNYGPWVEQLITQCKQFPHGSHDDLVDALVGGVQRIVTKGAGGRPQSREIEIYV